MKAFKRIAIIGAAVLVLGATTLSAAAFSGDYQTPAEIVAGLTGQSADTVIAQRSETGKTYGTIAEEAGVLDEFEQQMLDQKIALLEEKVAAGTLTRERADTIIAALNEHQAGCDGTETASGGIGSAFGAGFGNMSDNGLGSMSGNGTGSMNGNGLSCETGTAAGGRMAGTNGNRLGSGLNGIGCGLEDCPVAE